MSAAPVVFALAGLVCGVAAIVAVTHRDPRAAGAALLVTLVSLAVLYAGLAAPVVAGLVILVSLVATVPLAVHHTVPAGRPQPGAGPVSGGAAALLAGALLAILGLVVVSGEVPVNVSLRSSDGYDLAALNELLSGRSAGAVAGTGLVLLAAIVGARAARRAR